MKISRRNLLKTGATAAAAAAMPLALPEKIIAAERPKILTPQDKDFQFRMIIHSLNHPYWYADPARGNAGAAKAFFDKEAWEKNLKATVDDGYNAVLYSCDPWLVHQWQTWLVRYKEFPEARDLPEDKQQEIIKHVGWIFKKAKELGLVNILMNMCIVTTPAFARAHGLDKDMPVSDTVDWRHNYEHKVPGGASYDKMIHWGVRNELTRKFTEAAIAELFETYPDLDGLLSTMGEALPGRRSSWFKEAIVPGLRRTGRKPIFIVFHWMMPLEDFLEDIAPKDVYDNTWLAIEHNGEIICDTKPDPISVRWPEQSGVRTIVQYVAHNIGGVLPWNSPKYAWQIVKDARRIDHYSGFAYYVGGSALSSPDYDLFGKALAYYNEHPEPYSDDPWVAILEERFGDREAARHFVNAYDHSAEITPAVNQIAWSAHDGRCPNPLILKYWHWTDQDERFSQFVSPAQGATLLPVRYYAKIVVKQGMAFRDNNGSDYMRNMNQEGPVAHGHRGAQELMWGHIDYQVTPEEHFRKIRRAADNALKEAEEGLKTVKKNKDQAERLFKQMKAYQLLSQYYERKALAAIAALIYGFGGPAETRAEAEKLADETVELYASAANYMYEALDNKKGNIKGGWWDEQRDLPGMIEIEKKDRADLAMLFKWPAQPKNAEKKEGQPAQLGTTLSK